MSIITVVPVDKIIIVDGEALNFDFMAPADVHAIQWQNDKGHVEYTDPAKFPNKTLKQDDYNEYVKPYVDAFTKEKARLKAETERREKEYQEWYNSEEQVAIRVREERTKLISTTDYLLSPDYPIDAVKLEAVKAYRKALRDITKQEGFPHDVVWPANPMESN